MRLFIRFLLSGVVLVTPALAADKSPLADAPTAFVRAQAASAVHWQPWTDAVLAQAKKQGKSVYVFVGSPLSELTRATINQTFTSEKTVAWLNENFFCIFVDADAQPDVAAYGQHFIRTAKQLQGSPVHLWLTPELQPYDGANYLPPSEEWGKPGFLKAARSALDTWTGEPARARALAEEAISMMKLPPLDLSAKVDVSAKLTTATAAWIANLDAKNGGFGTAPKLPEPEVIRFLFSRGGVAGRAAALNAAHALVNGALHDPVGGGFYRRCIDEQWKEPYFQKTLADQARIALALFEAADIAKDDKLRVAAIGALDFVLKELRYPDGKFAAALDGTLEENADPAKRPKFVKVGTASSAALAQFVVALYKSGQNRLVGQIEKLGDQAFPGVGVTPHLIILAHSVTTSAEPTAADLLSTILMSKASREVFEATTEMLGMANITYFDPITGAYMATPAKLPSGIAARVPASGDTPSAEVLALLAGVDAKTADLIRRNLLSQIEYDELPPGDILLGLSQTQK